MSVESTTPRVIGGKFELVSQLGCGRLGKLFKARLLTSDKLVAVRVLNTALLADRKKALALMSQIVAVRSLHHRDICAVLGFHMGGERPYLVLEHVPGRTLQEFLDGLPGRRMDLDLFRPMAQSLLRALEFAHGRGLVHGNLHPRNIMVRPDGSPSILDSGIQPAGPGDFSETLAPELAAGGPATAQSDLFALGAIFYRMLTGTWPTAGAQSSPVVGAGAGVDHAVRSCLEDDPSRRPTPAQIVNEIDPKAPAPTFQEEVEAAPPTPQTPVDSVADGDSVRAGSKLAYQLPFSIAATLLLILSLALVAKRNGLQANDSMLAAAPRSASSAMVADFPVPSTGDAAPVRFRAGEIWTSPELASEFAYIPAGSATVGSPLEEAGRDSDEAPRSVEISRGFWMGRHEVTQREWESVMGTRPWEGKMESRPDLPATWVSWEQVNEFIHRLNRSAPGEAYRLPSEAEWEYAVRGGGTPYALGDPASELARVAWFRDNSNGELQPVGLREAGRWGLNDVQGNAWEWVHDWYSTDPGDARVDPQGPTSGLERVVRGCSFFNPASICRVANRHKVDPRSGDRHIGFRLVRDSR